MYLFHIYAFLAVLTLARHLWGAAWTPGIGCALAASLFTIGTAALSWHFIESPILGLKDRYFPPHPESETRATCVAHRGQPIRHSRHGRIGRFVTHQHRPRLE